MKRIWGYFFGTTFRKGASYLTLLTFGSYLLGLIRDRLFARTFGASRMLDIYNASFIVPDILLNIFVAGALSSAFIPIFTSLWSTSERKQSDPEANRLATTVLHAAVSTVIVVGLIAFFLMPMLALKIAPGFSPEEQKTLVSLARIMLISPILFAVSNTLGGMLVSFEKFVGYGLSPLFYNAGIISGIFLVPKFGIYGLAIGTLFGAFLHLLSRLIPLLRTGFRLQYPLQFKNPSFLKVVKLMIPKMIGQPMEQFAFLIFTHIASTLAIGSVAIVSFARNFQSVPVSVFGISLSTAIFSALAQNAAVHNRELFVRNFWKAAKGILGMTLLSMIFYILFGELVIRIFLGGGRFTEEAIVTTGKVLAIFALSVPTEAMIHLLARSFYALKDTLTPVMFALLGLVIIYFSAQYLKESIGITAIPLSFFIGSGIEVIILSVLLFFKLKKLRHASTVDTQQS